MREFPAGPGDEAWERWITRLYNLRRDKRNSHERPHKPVLLLTVLDLMDRGEIAKNRIPLSDELIATFRRFFEVVAKRDDRPKVETPFYHLSGDGFWQLRPRGGTASVYVPGEAAKPQSLGFLREKTDGAELDPELWNLLEARESREKVREALIARYFPNERTELLEVTGAGISEPFALNERLPQQRDAAFRRLVLEVYDYRCSACGIRVVLQEGTLAEAAHLIPFSVSFNDNPSNGIALCPNHHWAMDRNLVAPCPDERSPAGIWKVSPRLDDRIDNQRDLLALNGRRVIEPKEKRFLPSREGLQWRESKLVVSY